MRLLVHLSDLHFGRNHLSRLDPLATAVADLRPHLAVISGDLTQHAFPREFAEAAEFLRRLPEPRIVVPGNHDMSFYNPVRRAIQGLALYRQYISADLEPFYQDEEIAVAGFSTPRRTLLRGGHVSEPQVTLLEQRMREAAPGAVRVLVTHHPFDLPESYRSELLVRGRKRRMERVIRSVDLLLAGHVHISHSGPSAGRYRAGGQNAIFVQAGSALSERLPEQVNAFQAVRTEKDEITVDRFAWDADREAFLRVGSAGFRRSANGWERSPGAEPAVTTATIR